MRLTSSFWVSAYLRRLSCDGIPGVVLRRGNAEAGAIFIRVDRLDGTCDLYGPAPQTAFSGSTSGGRLFVRFGAPKALPDREVEQRLSREVAFDPDLWIIAIESRDGRHGLDLAASDHDM